VEGKETPLPSAKLIAHLGGKEAGLTGRIKDFTVVQPHGMDIERIIVGGSSDGTIRLWRISLADLKSHDQATSKQIGDFLGTYETGNRITCLTAFVMLARAPDEEEVSGEDEANREEEVSSSSDSE
jgi:protein MAK11